MFYHLSLQRKFMSLLEVTVYLIIKQLMKIDIFPEMFFGIIVENNALYLRMYFKRQRY